MAQGPARRAALAATLLLSLGLAGRAAAASMLDVDWTKACGSASCFNSKGAYSLSFSASQFSGPVDISKLLLDRSVLGSNISSFFSVTFTLGGHTLGSWGDWNLGSVGGDTFSLSGPDLMWNPADGDLVVTLQLVSANGEILDGTDHGGGGFFGDSTGPGGPDTPGGGPTDGGPNGFDGPQDPPFGPPNGGGGPVIDGPGPNGPAGAVPEPATWALLIGGLATTGAVLRRRRALSLA